MVRRIPRESGTPRYEVSPDLAADGIEVQMQPWAEKVYKERQENNSKDWPNGHCIPNRARLFGGSICSLNEWLSLTSSIESYRFVAKTRARHIFVGEILSDAQMRADKLIR